MDSPAAEIEVDEHLVRTLLARQHPDLADLPVTPLDAGWDNTLWRLGEGLLVRLPRRAVSAPLALHEQRWLPELERRLPLPISAPLRVGRPSDGYPWSWSIVPWLAGRPGDTTEITAPDRAADQLGRFLRALHVEAPPEAPRNPYRGGALSTRAEAFEQRISELASEVDAPAIRHVWERACAAPSWLDPPVWLHGDLHPANVLVLDGALGAVIDFGDVCAGDPATDVAAAWMLLPESAVATFATSYGGIEPALEVRALGWALLFGLMLLAIGLDDRPTYEPIGRGTIARVIRPRVIDTRS